MLVFQNTIFKLNFLLLIGFSPHFMSHAAYYDIYLFICILKFRCFYKMKHLQIFLLKKNLIIHYNAQVFDEEMTSIAAK